MVIDAGPSKRPHGPLKGDWGSCSVTRLQLDRLATQGYLLDLDLTSTRPSLISVDGQVQADSHPMPHGDERVCFGPFLLCGLGFPIHPFCGAFSSSMGYNSTTSCPIPF
jgi:hypothetical protein